MQCGICGLHFSTNYNLNSHKRLHTGFKPFHVIDLLVMHTSLFNLGSVVSVGRSSQNGPTKSPMPGHMWDLRLP